MTEFDVELDARGLICPLPLLRAKNALSQMASGQVLRITATDKGSPIDLAVFCDKTGNEMLSSVEQDDEFVFMVRRR